ncbi:Sec-independent protein translocase protein TatB [Thermomonas paludicola]|uniref:Sec-independent protein translocase protein TatB n=1 Tax=Thermomonas paludicola TaxID=2884874 RepID=UPI003CCD411E
MFDFSFGEMLVVALVALIVLGPERLPKAARFAGLWVRKARAQWYAMKNELEQELASEELKRSLQETRQALQDAEAQLRQASADLPKALEPPPAVDTRHDD